MGRYEIRSLSRKLDFTLVAAFQMHLAALPSHRSPSGDHDLGLV